MKKKLYELPNLEYDYNALEPHISEQIMRLHHSKHHQGYVDNANKILKKLDEARESGNEIDMKSTLKSLTFNVGGHILHSLFWKSMSPKGGGEPEGKIKEQIDKEFGSFERFKTEFFNAAKSVEGSGWGALAYCKKTNRLMLMHIEKHNLNIYPMFNIIMALDVWEHAYYLDYKNKRGDYIEAFWNVIDWNKINQRLESVMEED